MRARLAPGITFTANGRELPAADIVAMVELNRKLDLAGEVFFHYGGLRRNGRLHGKDSGARSRLCGVGLAAAFFPCRLKHFLAYQVSESQVIDSD